jgi:dTDP-4-amino-4,6-dideoxygalactose transaminase
MNTWNRYNEAFQDLKQKGVLELPYIPEYCKHNAHMYYMKTDNLETRTKLLVYLKEHGVLSVFHYVPLHSAPAGLKFGRFNGEDVYTTKESERLVRLPLYYGIKTNEVEYIIDCVREFYGAK